MKSIWENVLAKEFILMMIATAAAQLAFGINDLLGAVETSKNWGDLLTSGSAWAGAFSFSLTITLIKQACVWAATKLVDSGF